MPRSKPDPVEMKKDVVRRKLLFIALIAALVGLTHVVITNRSSSSASDESKPKTIQAQNESKEAILGETTEKSHKAREEFLTEASENIQATATTVERSTQGLIDDTKEKVHTSFNDLVYSTTIKPIIAKIQSLPADQQIHILEAICKPQAP